MGLIGLLAVGALLVAISLVLFAIRRSVLLGGVGAVEMSLKLRRGSRTQGWAVGIGWFTRDELFWYRVFSLSPRPTRRLSRRELVVLSRRRPTAAETAAVPAGAVILECQTGSARQDIAMTDQAMNGFLSWLESQPPGSAVTGRAAG